MIPDNLALLTAMEAPSRGVSPTMAGVVPGDGRFADPNAPGHAPEPPLGPKHTVRPVAGPLAAKGRGFWLRRLVVAQG